MWFINPGQKICDHFHVEGEHAMVLRIMANIHWYGHHAVWLAYLFADQISPF